MKKDSKNYHAMRLNDILDKAKAIVGAIINDPSVPVGAALLELSTATHIAEAVYRETHKPEEWESYLLNKALIAETLNARDAADAEANNN